MQRILDHAKRGLGELLSDSVWPHCGLPSKIGGGWKEQNRLQFKDLSRNSKKRECTLMP